MIEIENAILIKEIMFTTKLTLKHQIPTADD